MRQAREAGTSRFTVRLYTQEERKKKHSVIVHVRHRSEREYGDISTDSWQVRMFAGCHRHIITGQLQSAARNID